MAGGGQVGALRVLMGADWAQLQADMAKAKGVVADSRAEFALFGRAGKDAKNVLVDLGEGSHKTGKAAKELSTLFGRALGGFSKEGAEVVKILNEGIAGGIGKLALSAAAAMAAVGYATNVISEAWTKAKDSEKAYLEGSARLVNDVMKERAELVDRRLGANWEKVRRLASEADLAQRKAAESSAAFTDQDWWWTPGGKQTALKKMQDDALAADKATQALNSEVVRGFAASSEAADRFHDSLRRGAEDDALRESLKNLPEPFRRATEDAARRAREFRSQIDAVVPSSEAVARYLKSIPWQEKAAAEAKAADAAKLRASLEEEAASAAERARRAGEAAASEAFVRPYKERADRAREVLEATVGVLSKSTAEAGLRADIARLEEQRARASGVVAVALDQALASLRETLDLEVRTTAEKERQKRVAEELKRIGKEQEAIAAGIERAAELRAESDAEAAAAVDGLSAKERELLKLRQERDAELKKIPGGGGILDVGGMARAALTEEYRRKELAIEDRYAKLALEGDRDSDRARRLEAKKADAEILGDVRLQTEALLDEERDRYARELDLIRKAALDGQLSRSGAARASELALYAHESRMELIRERGARAEVERQRELALTGDDVTAGFTARISQLREETGAWGQLGASIADMMTVGLSQGVAGAIDQVARGTKTASEAFREWGANFGFEVARMIEQALILKAILSIFPGLGSGGAPASGAVPAAATGGAFRVGGMGGLDSQLAVMRVSPGELIRVSNGAEAAGGGGGGGVNLSATFVLRPPGVLADRVAEKMSRDARGGLVAASFARGGRRAARPVE